MSNQNELAVMQQKAIEAPALSIQDAYAAVLENKLDGPRLDVMERLLKMSAEQQFNQAFVALQAALPVIVAKTEIKNRGRYEKFEDVMAVVGPILQKHGFSVSFNQSFADKRIIETCTLSHAGGHSRANSFAVRVGPADSETQSDCKASTTAKRNSLLNALNIVIRQDAMQSEDDDATLTGDPDAKITPQQAGELERRVMETNSNVKAFLQFAGAPNFDSIPANKYDMLDDSLRRKERLGK